MTTLRCPIVGMHFRPPAKLVLAALPAGAGLRLSPEPDNPYDPQAVQVWASPAEIPESQLGTLAFNLTGMGWDLSDLMAQTEIQLGYLISEGNKARGQFDPNSMALELMDRGPVRASLGFAPDGRALAVISQAKEN